MSYQDKNLTCSECLQPFASSAEDQQLSSDLGYGRLARCRSCWQAREDQRGDEGGAYHTPTRFVARGRAQPTEPTTNPRGRQGTLSIQMGSIMRLFRRGGQTPRRPASSESLQTRAERDAARKYWKAEVTADRQRRGTPDNHPR